LGGQSGSVYTPCFISYCLTAIDCTVLVDRAGIGRYLVTGCIVSFRSVLQCIVLKYYLLPKQEVMFSAVLARNAANLLKYSLLSGFNWCRYCPVRRTGTYFGDGTPYRHSWCHSGATCKISQRYQFFTHHVLKYSHRKTHKTFTNYNYVFFCVCIFCLLFGDVYGFQNRCSTDCPERLVSLKWSVQSLVC